MDLIEATQRRTIAYWFVDGIAEMVGGSAITLIGTMLVLATVTGSDAWGSAASVALLLAIPAVGAIVSRLKERVTYPRTGFVVPKEPSRGRRGVAAIAAAIAAVGLVVLASRAPSTSNVVVAAFSVGVAAAFVVRANRMGMPRLHATAVAVTLAGVWATVFAAGYLDGIGVILATFGLSSVGTGGFALATYLREAPAQEEGE